MTNMVTHINIVDMPFVVETCMRYKSRYGPLWTCRGSTPEEWDFIFKDWLNELSKFPIRHVENAISKSLILFVNKPPSLTELIQLCMKESGVPDQNEIINLMIARDFNHPLVKMIYDKIGSWMLSNGKSDDIQRKVKEYYNSEKSEFYINPQKYWEQLALHNAKPKELPPPTKIPSKEESKAFREFMNKCQEILQSKKIYGAGKTYKHYDANKVNPRHREFDQLVFEEFKTYLMAIPETETMILPPAYVLARNKFLNMRDQADYLRKAGYIPPNERESFASPKPSDKKSGPKPVYKAWVKD